MGKNELIEKAMETLITGKPRATAEDKKQIEAPDAIVANELLARRAQLVEQIKELTAEKNAIEDVFRDAIGSKEVLTVHGAKVASIARWRETRVLSDVVKEMFPLIDFPELYKRETKSRLTVH